MLSTGAPQSPTQTQALPCSLYCPDARDTGHRVREGVLSQVCENKGRLGPLDAPPTEAPAARTSIRAAVWEPPGTRMPSEAGRLGLRCH